MTEYLLKQLKYSSGFSRAAVQDVKMWDFVEYVKAFAQCYSEKQSFFQEEEEWKIIAFQWFLTRGRADNTLLPLTVFFSSLS